MSIPKRPSFKPEREGPGMTLVLIVLVVVAVLGAKYYGFLPGGKPIATEPEIKVDVGNVLLYSAHPTENYSPSAAHAQGLGDVVSLLGRLRDELSVQGVNAHVAESVMGVTWDQSFVAARQTLLPHLSQENGVEAVLDIHRDALETQTDGYTTVMVGQNPVAKVLLVIGDVDNPYIEQNLAFAEALRAELDKLAPGICRGVKIMHDQVNGDLHPHSVQVFIGDYTDNTLAEAQVATSYLAQALVQVIKR